MPPPPQTTSLHDAASQIIQLVVSTIAINTPPRASHHNTQAINLVPMSTTISTSALTTHITTYQTPPAALQGMATSIVTSTISSTTATPLAKPLLESSPNVLPDWPPILAIFLLSWQVMAWVLTVVLFLASFPEKVAWLDRIIERWRGGGRRERYVNKKDHIRSLERFHKLITLLQVYSTPIYRLDMER
jgi:hypothetical protein